MVYIIIQYLCELKYFYPIIKMRLSENDHASSVLPNTKRIFHVFRVATNVCVAIATRAESLLKRNGQPTSTTTSMSPQAGRKHISARH